jgi:hypothetical protein
MDRVVAEEWRIVRGLVQPEFLPVLESLGFQWTSFPDTSEMRV